jgi:hypothetical protein
MEGKGGVGKSLVASLLFQYLKFHEKPVSGCDTDPVNSTFAGYTEFGVSTLPLMNGEDIDSRKFDELIDNICSLSEDEHIIVDNGASSFVALCSYAKESGALTILSNQGHTVLLHSVVTGGLGMQDTLMNIESLIKHFQFPIVAWLNPYFGEIVTDGRDFWEFKVYKSDPSRFKAVIKLPKFKAETFGRDFEDILIRRWTFDQAINSSLPIMARSRLSATWQKIRQTMDEAGLI